MSTDARTQTQTITTEQHAPSLLDQVIDETLKQKVHRINGALSARAEEIERLLPNFMRGQAPRLIARAMQYFARGDWRLQKCSEASFVKCIMEAAELGFAIDGKMVHAVPRKIKRKENGEWYEWYEAGLIPDYKSLIAVAKRSKTIQDCWARIIYESDEFTYEEKDGRVIYSHRPDIRRERYSLDGAICVLAVATHADGWFRTELMPTADVMKIRNRSNSYQDADSKTPWNSDVAEMAKKTALRRLLKTFNDDPGLIRLMEIDDKDYQIDDDTEPSGHGLASEGAVGEVATPASASSTPANKTQQLAADLRREKQVEGKVGTAADIMKTQASEVPENWKDRIAKAHTIDAVRNLVGAWTDCKDVALRKQIIDAGLAREAELTPKPEQPKSDPPKATWPLKENGKIDWQRSTPEQKTAYALSEIKANFDKAIAGGKPETCLKWLAKMQPGIVPQSYGEAGYKIVMEEINKAEKRLMQPPQQADETPPFGEMENTPTLTEQDQAALAELRSGAEAVTTAEELNSLRQIWESHKESVTAAGYAAGVAIIDERAKG